MYMCITYKVYIYIYVYIHSESPGQLGLPELVPRHPPDARLGVSPIGGY